MKIRKSNFILMAICCAVSASWTKIQCMDEHGINEEYQKQKKVCVRFFGEPTRNIALRLKINDISQKLESGKPLPVINLDNLSSRTRIKLFRELTSICKNNSLSLPFKFNNKKFYIKLKQSLIQRGNGILTTIGTHDDIYCVLDSYKLSYQKKIANKLLVSRSNSNAPILNPNLLEEGIKVDLEILNILLDFEVARRLQTMTTAEKEQAQMNLELREAVLDMAEQEFFRNSNVYFHGERCDFQGDEEQEKDKFLRNYVKTYENEKKQFQYFEKLQLNIESNKEELRAQSGANSSRSVKYSDMYDDLPIAAGIVGMLKLSTQDNNTKEFSTFFKADKSYYDFSYGDLNCFMGAAIPNHRERALKKIIKARSQSQTLEEIHQEYLEVFGGSSESDGGDYNELLAM